ncbi:MAG: DUF2807 domain-containing protein [Bacteroidota bacterium]
MKTQKYFRMLAMAGFSMISGISSAYAQAETNKLVLPAFNTIVISSPVDIKLLQGTETSVSIEDGDINKELTAEVKDSILTVKGRSSDMVTINFNEINKIELLSNCELHSGYQINADKLEVSLNGAASDIFLDLKVGELTTSISGAGEIEYQGAADMHTIEIEGAGDISAYDLVTTNTTVNISGAGDAKVNVKQNLKGVINGAGNIKYWDEPANKDIQINGVGSYGKQNANIEETYGDTTRIKAFGSKILIIPLGNDSIDKKSDDHRIKNFRVYWSGIGLGVNGYLNANNKTSVPAGYDFLDLDYRRSINVSLNFWEKNFQIWKNHINLVTGLGFDFSNYSFDNNYVLHPDSNYISGDIETSVVFKRNKLTTTYLNMPLLLQFDTKPFGKHNRTVHLSAGVVGSVKLGSHIKQVYELNGVEYKPKTKDDFNLSPFRYSAMVRVGVGKLDLFASYALNELFKKNEGPQLYPFTIGINLIGF